MTSLHHKVQSLMGSVVDTYYEQVKISERTYQKDMRCATKIQAQYRMYRFYKHYQRNR